ncbi:MAG TPA: hypothetical protein VNV63_06730, partial [Nitrospiria bacterium]|nr:hypothetical protein [Nitrospiria bacterium]
MEEEKQDAQEAPVQIATEPTKPPASLFEALLIAMYTALNSDILRRLSDRFFLTFGLLSIAATLIS